MDAHVIRLVYLTAVTVAMIGWSWILLSGLGWILGF
jgi:hypothetical protein